MIYRTTKYHFKNVPSSQTYQIKK